MGIEFSGKKNPQNVFLPFLQVTGFSPSREVKISVAYPYFEALSMIP